MVKVSNLGYPRLGENREWKKLIESYWAGNISQDELQAEAKALHLSDTGITESVQYVRSCQNRSQLRRILF